MSTISVAYGSYQTLTVTSLQSLASSITAGWQSDRISNLSNLADNYEIAVSVTTANTAPGSDKTVYIFAVPMITTDNGSTWIVSDQGTTTLPTGAQGTTTIAAPNDLKLIGQLNYTTQNMTMQGIFSLCPAAMTDVPDGFSIIIINFTGAALGTGCTVGYRTVNYTIA